MRDAATERSNAASRLGRRRREISTKRKKDTILTERSQELTEIKGVGLFKSAKQTVFGLQKCISNPRIWLEIVALCRPHGTATGPLGARFFS
jgi:hypothetical protein